MKIYTSYFYQIRFFKPNQIPISTAMSDPKWFHDFKGSSHVYKDKNGVYNGIRCAALAPGPRCHNLCHGSNGCLSTPAHCAFLREYGKQLAEIDFSEFSSQLQRIGDKICAAEHLTEEPEFVLIVHEPPTRDCSERGPLQKWLAVYNVGGTELETTKE